MELCNLQAYIQDQLWSALQMNELDYQTSHWIVAIYTGTE